MATVKGMAKCMLSIALATSPAEAAATAGRPKILKGISYGPTPLKDNSKTLPHDDFFYEDNAKMWSEEDGGRGDLQIIKDMGANVVRLYGNHPGKDHSAFLEMCDEKGLFVIAGMSDYPYTQSPDNCITTQFDCYKQVKESYSQNLKRGFLTKDLEYHQALYSFILLNEPDLKLDGVGSDKNAKALLSAFDAVIDAEKEVGVVNPDIKFTFTMSFAVCTSCSSNIPALGQMLKLRSAFKDPASVGYTPRNDNIWELYQQRFENSFNTANPYKDVRDMFMVPYNKEFKDLNMPVVIGEYHQPGNKDLKTDLTEALKLADEKDTLFVGYSFFEFQVRYDKGGAEMEFGMFGLGKKFDEGVMDGAEFDVYCLTKVEDEHQNIPDTVAAVYGGKVPDNLCGGKQVQADFQLV